MPVNMDQDPTRTVTVDLSGLVAHTDGPVPMGGLALPGSVVCTRGREAIVRARLTALLGFLGLLPAMRGPLRSGPLRSGPLRSGPLQAEPEQGR